MPNPLQEIVLSWKKSLQIWAAEGSISRAARDALALQGVQAKPDQLVNQWTQGDFSGLPPIELLDGEAKPSAAGAYAASTGTFYTNRYWLDNASNDHTLTVLTEELGNHLDATLNPGDSPGDEGELFARMILDSDLSASDEAEIRAQRDSTLIQMMEQPTPAETAKSFVIDQSQPNPVFITHPPRMPRNY